MAQLIDFTYPPHYYRMAITSVLYNECLRRRWVTKNCCIKWLREMGLLTRQKLCNLCQSHMTEGANARRTDGRARTLH